MGYCSKCYKELVRDAPKQAAQSSPVKGPSGGGMEGRGEEGEGGVGGVGREVGGSCSPTAEHR